MSILNQMIEDTKKSLQENFIIAEKRIQQEVQKKEERKTIGYNPNSREVKMIISLGLQINTYEPKDPEASYYDAQEFYYCSNERWDVYIRNLLYDADLGSVLQVLELTDKFTGEKIDFYCDLWCGNTSEHRLEQFKILLSTSFEQYKKIEFGKYFSLPNLLRDKGYIVEEKNFDFDTVDCIGSLIVYNLNISNTPCEIKVSHDHSQCVYVNNLKRDRCWDDVISYSIDYKNEQDIGIMCKNIDKIIEHIDGKYGYLENNRYYTNEDIEVFFDEYKNKLNYLEDMSDAYRSAFHYNDEPTEEESKEYEKICEIAEINHYKGAEIYKKYELIINRDAYYFGGIGNTYEFEIIHNTNIDKDNCILNITYTLSDYIGWNNKCDDDIQNEKSEHVTQETIKGSYIFVMNILADFLNKLIEVEQEFSSANK